MSGSAGGHRIHIKNVQQTVDRYVNEVLSNIQYYTQSVITGSYTYSHKKTFGDIDLIVQINGINKVNSKKILINVIKNLSDNIIVPFKSEKYLGKKYLNTGEIITVLYPVVGEKNKFVQIDNVVSLNDNETKFKNIFLCYDAPVQGLMLGLVKAALVESNDKEVMKEFEIPYSILKENEEYEFNLSSNALTLRLVTYGSNYKMLKRTDVWSTKKWSYVVKLLKGYNLNTDFDGLFEQVKFKLKYDRSRKRVSGTFSVMVSVKSGEIGTPKGDEKCRTLEKINNL